MIELIWDEKFKRLFKIVIDPFHPSLKTHSLSGILKGSWAMRINYEQRLIFRFVDKEKKKVLLIDLGTHNEVY